VGWGPGYVRFNKVNCVSMTVQLKINMVDDRPVGVVDDRAAPR
jgi:hypothetical protein